MPKLGPWHSGINNKSTDLTAPLTSLRDAYNVVPDETGLLRSTRTPELLLAGSFTAVRAFPSATVLLGANPIIMDRSGQQSVGRQASDVVDSPQGLLFVSPAGVFDSNGDDLAVGSSLPVVDIVAGSLMAGTYRVAFAELRNGREMPCFDFAIPINDGEGLDITAPADGFVFASDANGSELYLVADVVANQIVSVPRQVAGRPPLHLNAQPMIGGHLAVLHAGTLVVASGQYTLSSKPYEYGITDATSMYTPWPAQITALVSADNKLYVGADRLYHISPDGVQVLIDEPVVAASRPAPDHTFVVSTTGGLYLVDGTKADSAIPDAFACPAVLAGSVVVADKFPFDGVICAIEHDGWPQGVDPLTF